MAPDKDQPYKLTVGFDWTRCRHPAGWWVDVAVIRTGAARILLASLFSPKAIPSLPQLGNELQLSDTDDRWNVKLANRCGQFEIIRFEN